MKILSRGFPQEDRLYRAVCKDCKTVFEFMDSEATEGITVIERGANVATLAIRCPVCCKTINVLQRHPSES